MNDILPTYIEPCLSDRRNSIESVWLYASDFGECYPPPSDILIYPPLIPVYNGKVLEINSELVHESLSGISIKHYYGKCFKDEVDEEIGEGIEERFGIGFDGGVFYEKNGENDSDWNLFGGWSRDAITPEKNASERVYPPDSSSNSRSFEYRENQFLEGQPMCTLPKINYRNSFWNIHRPELCKLTWGQKYVGVTLVTEHLHEHLFHHGSLCAGFHTQEERECMLKKELDEYVRLKVLACPRELPPDEPLFNFKSKRRLTNILANPRCKKSQVSRAVDAIHYSDRYIEIKDEDDDGVGDGIRIQNVRRSKEEFCLTIGKHIRKPPILQPESVIPEGYITSAIFPNEEEEGSGLFYFNWLLCPEEESFGKNSGTESQSLTTSEEEPEVEPCPPLMMDEFCKAAGKVNFSDLRCDPDF